MGEDETVDDMKMEKRSKSKSKKKSKNSEAGDVVMHPVTDEIEVAQGSEKDDFRETKKRKKKKNKGSEDAGEIKVGVESANKDELIGVDSVVSDGDNIHSVERKKEKKEKKEKKKKLHGSGGPVFEDRNAKETEVNVEGQYRLEEGNISGIKSNKENVEGSAGSIDDREVHEKHERKKSKKKRKDVSSDIPVPETVGSETDANLSADASHDNRVEGGNKRETENNKPMEKPPDDVTPCKSNKKVRFSGEDEVFRLPDDSNVQSEEETLVRGKRFTNEEDEIVKQAVWRYIADYDLGEEGLNMVLSSSKHPELKGCWKEIASAIPYRPYTAIYSRAQVLFKRSATRKWTKEEIEMVRKSQEEHGNHWKDLADELGKHHWHVKDTWRRIKNANLKKGNWSQKEYQELFDLVNLDLQLKLSEEKISKHGMLRDNISWTAISDKVSTRTQAACCLKWYHQLTSRMVAEGVWADADDYRLLGSLYSLDANCMEDVDWDNLLDNRSGDLCRKRWNQMVLHIGHHGNKSFAEQVEVLAQRYCPNLIEAREAWDSKPRVP